MSVVLPTEPEEDTMAIKVEKLGEFLLDSILVVLASIIDPMKIFYQAH
jgi:hypothetical protein